MAAVVETARFLKDVKPMMSNSGREHLVAFVGANRRPVRSSRRPAAYEKSAGQ
jgi:hypothetical protein